MTPAKKRASKRTPARNPKPTQLGRVAKEKCPHPEKAKRNLGYATICDDCKTLNPQVRK